MKFFSKFLTRFYFGTALALSAFGLGATQAHAESDHDNARMTAQQDAFQNYKFVPGTKWYRLNEELPAQVVREVGNDMGAPLCIREVSTGVFESNLMPCKERLGLADPSIGLMNPLIKSGPTPINWVVDYVGGNWTHDMIGLNPFDKVRKDIAERIQDKVAAWGDRPYNSTYVAEAAAPQVKANTVAAAAPSALVRVTGPALASQGDTETWIRASADGDRKNSVKLLRRYAGGQLVDVVTSGRGMKGKVYAVSFAQDGKLKWNNASPALTQIALAPVEQKAMPVVLAAAPMAATFPGFTAEAGSRSAFFGNDDSRYMNEFYARVRGEATKPAPLAAWAFDSRFYDLPQGFNTVATAPIMARSDVVVADLRPSIAEGTDADILPVVNAPAADVAVGTVKRNGQTYTTLTAANGDEFHLATGRANQKGEFVRPWAPGGLVKAFRVEHEGKATKYSDAKIDSAKMKSLMTFVQAEVRAKQATRLAMR